MRPTEVLTILHDDADLIAIDKPAGLASVPGGGEKQSANAMIARQIGIPFKGDVDPRIRPVHRIDKETSGLLLFAKNRPAQQSVSIQFQNNRIEKSYLALVAGEVNADEGTIDQPIANDDKDRIRRRVARHGKPALTHWKLVQRFRGYALLRVYPKTGKTHQIRVHLAHVGLPLAVDALYGRREAAEHGLLLSTFKRGYRPPGGHEERPLIARLTLHAESLTLLHPNGSPLSIRVEPPKDFRAALNQLTKHAS